MPGNPLDFAPQKPTRKPTGVFLRPCRRPYAAHAVCVDRRASGAAFSIPIPLFSSSILFSILSTSLLCFYGRRPDAAHAVRIHRRTSGAPIFFIFVSRSLFCYSPVYSLYFSSPLLFSSLLLFSVSTAGDLMPHTQTAPIGELFFFFSISLLYSSSLFLFFCFSSLLFSSLLFYFYPCFLSGLRHNRSIAICALLFIRKLSCFKKKTKNKYGRSTASAAGRARRSLRAFLLLTTFSP